MAKKTIKRARLNVARITKLYKAQGKTKSVSAIASKVSASYMGVRLVLIRQGLLKG